MGSEGQSLGIEELLRRIRNYKFDPAEVARLDRQRGQPLYLPWQTVCRALDQLTGGRWRSDVLHSGIERAMWRQSSDDAWSERDWAVCHVKLTIIDAAGEFVSRTAAASVLCDAGPPPLETAERSALKRAAMLFGLGDNLSEYEQDVPRGGQRRGDRRPPPSPQRNAESDGPAPAQHPVPDAQHENTGNGSNGEDRKPCPVCTTGTVGRRRDGEWFSECRDCSANNRKGPHREPPRRNAPAKADDYTCCIQCGTWKRSEGDFCGKCASEQAASVNADVVAMVDILPDGDPSAFTAFLRRLEASNGGTPERRYLWERAQRVGLDYDKEQAAFVRQA